MFKITAGEFKGRNLKTPVTGATHPMGSREKLALFNTLISVFSASDALGGRLENVNSVLDCYCGSGALGLEALSRGVKRAVFVDNNAAALQATKANIEALAVSDRAEVIHADVNKLTSTSVSWQQYDLILVDPPYDAFPETLAQLTNLLAPAGVIVLSHPTSVTPASIFPDLELLSTKSYASARLSFFRAKP